MGLALLPNWSWQGASLPSTLQRGQSGHMRYPSTAAGSHRRRPGSLTPRRAGPERSSFAGRCSPATGSRRSRSRRCSDCLCRRCSAERPSWPGLPSAWGRCADTWTSAGRARNAARSGRWSGTKCRRRRRGPRRDDGPWFLEPAASQARSSRRAASAARAPVRSPLDRSRTGVCSRRRRCGVSSRLRRRSRGAACLTGKRPLPRTSWRGSLPAPLRATRAAS